MANKKSQHATKRNNPLHKTHHHKHKSHHTLLETTLAARHLALQEVLADGNCLFRALAHQLTRNEQRHADVRHSVVEHMASHKEEFAPFLTFGEGEQEDDATFEDYVERMRRDGEWGGQPELLAAVQALRVDIVVHQSPLPSYKLESSAPDATTIHISYHDGEHYNSVVPVGDTGGTTEVRGLDAPLPLTPGERRARAACAFASEEAVRAALDECGGDVDSATGYLQALRLGESPNVVSELAQCDVEVVPAHAADVVQQGEPEEVVPESRLEQARLRKTKKKAEKQARAHARRRQPLPCDAAAGARSGDNVIAL